VTSRGSTGPRLVCAPNEQTPVSFSADTRTTHLYVAAELAANR